MRHPTSSEVIRKLKKPILNAISKRKQAGKLSEKTQGGANMESKIHIPKSSTPV